MSDSNVFEIFRIDPTENIAHEERLPEFLKWAVDAGASDVVFRSNEKIWARIHGSWREVSSRKIRGYEMNDLLTMTRGSESAISLVNSGHPEDYAYEAFFSGFEADEDGVLLPGAKRKSLRFRANATSTQTPDGAGISICMRVIPEHPPTMDDIGVPQAIRDGLFPKAGLVLVVGPVGSGKSTLLFSGLRYIAENTDKHIITYEHPIEFDLLSLPNKTALVEQTEIGVHIDSFSTAPPNSLRRAGDVVLFGESRDPESIKYMTIVAETGVAVYTTLHANSVATTIQRIIEEFPHAERDTMAATLIRSVHMIVHQRLVRRPDGKGRTPIQEWILFDDDLRRKLLDVETKMQPSIIAEETAKRQSSLLDDLERKYEQGLVADIDYQEYKHILSKGPIE